MLAVHPYLEDRRTAVERRKKPALPIVPESRDRTDRRQLVRRDMEQGWLLFKADRGRRRFTPIIPGWETAPVEELQKLLSRAVPARRRGDPLGAAVIKTRLK